MPLKSGHSEKTIGENIRELHHGPQYARTKANHGSAVANKQAIAVAESVARRAKERASGGRAAAEVALPADHQLGMRVPKGGSMCANCEYLASPTECGNKGFIKWNGGAKLPHAADEYCCDLYGLKSKARAHGGKVHVGPIRTKHPGRTDTEPMKVADGSYVLPSETVSHLGQNNSEAGLRVADSLFGVNGSYGKSDATPRARGGKAEEGKPIDCITAGGEYVIGPDKVKAIGGGDIDLGHKILDKFVLNQRKAHIHALASLAPPARD